MGALNNKTFQTPQNYLLNANGVTNAAGVIPGGFSYLMSFGQDLDVTVTAAASDTRARDPPAPPHPDLAQRAGQHLRG